MPDYGDTISGIPFVSVTVDPYRLVVTGRIKHFISAFGEHVIGEEVEYSLMKAAKEEGVQITEFTVAPISRTARKKENHFMNGLWNLKTNRPICMHSPKRWIATCGRKNIYYDDLISGNILQPLQIHPVKKNGFIDYMKSIGKLGGQNKVPRLSNDRSFAEPWKNTWTDICHSSSWNSLDLPFTKLFS